MIFAWSPSFATLLWGLASFILVCNAQHHVPTNAPTYTPTSPTSYPTSSPTYGPPSTAMVNEIVGFTFFSVTSLTIIYVIWGYYSYEREIVQANKRTVVYAEDVSEEKSASGVGTHSYDDENDSRFKNVSEESPLLA